MTGTTQNNDDDNDKTSFRYRKEYGLAPIDVAPIPQLNLEEPDETQEFGYYGNCLHAIVCDIIPITAHPPDTPLEDRVTKGLCLTKTCGDIVPITEDKYSKLESKAYMIITNGQAKPHTYALDLYLRK